MQLKIEDIKFGTFAYNYRPNYNAEEKGRTFWNDDVTTCYIHKPENKEPFWAKEVRGYFGSCGYSSRDWNDGSWHPLVPIMEVVLNGGGTAHKRILNKDEFMARNKKLNEDGGFLYENGDYTRFFHLANINYVNYLDIQTQRDRIYQDNWQAIYLLKT